MCDFVSVCEMRVCYTCVHVCVCVWVCVCVCVCLFVCVGGSRRGCFPSFRECIVSWFVVFGV